MKHGPASVHFVECNIVVPPGPFWLVLKASGEFATYVSFYVASDSVAPQRSIFAETYDGGVSWDVKESRGGPGHAVRLEATLDISDN